MDDSYYLLAVIFMAAIGAAAAIGALVMTFRHLGTHRFTRAQIRQLAFEFPGGPAPARAPEPQPKPPPTPPARLEMALVSPDAPRRLRIPVNLASGRILELGLPLRLSTRGGRALDDLRLSISLPNEITYGASLEELTASPPGPKGARAGYSSGASHTSIEIELPHAPGDAEIEIAIPVCVRRDATGAYPLVITATCEAVGEIQCSYELELVAEGEDAEPAAMAPGALVCRPAEAERVRDPGLPLDRIGRFSLEEGSAPPPPEPAAEPTAEEQAAHDEAEETCEPENVLDVESAVAAEAPASAPG